MGKKAPSPPDPVATAQAQGAMNVDTARVQAKLNRPDTYTPFGSVVSHEGPNDKWDTTVTLAPDQQRLLDLSNQLSTRGSEIALNQLPRVEQVFSSPLSLDTGNEAARQRETAMILSRLEPQFERDREGLEGRLTSQGFAPGSEAYNRATDELARARTDARIQAEGAGTRAAREAAAFGNQVQLAQRQQPLAEIGALFGLGPGLQQPQAQAMTPVAVATPDLQGQVASNYAQQSQQYGANMGAMGALGGALLGGAFRSPWMGGLFGMKPG